MMTNQEFDSSQIFKKDIVNNMNLIEATSAWNKKKWKNENEKWLNELAAYRLKKAKEAEQDEDTARKRKELDAFKEKHLAQSAPNAKVTVKSVDEQFSAELQLKDLPLFCKRWHNVVNNSVVLPSKLRREWCTRGCLRSRTRRRRRRVWRPIAARRVC